MIRAGVLAATGLALATGAPAFAQSSGDWTGFSVGVVGGALQTKDSEEERLFFDRNLDGVFNETVRSVAGADAFSPGFCDGAANGVSAAQGCDDDKDGAEAALRVGYDWQWGSFVVGGVAEIAGSSAEDSVTGFSTTPASYTFKRNLQGVAAARLRLGYAMDRALFYGTGGYAKGRIDSQFGTSNATNDFTTTSEREQDADGWQAGGGLEYRLAPNLSVIGEYLYTSLDAEDPFVVRVGRGSAPATNPFILPPNVTGTDIIRSNDKFRTHSVRIGMAYRF